MCVLLCNVLILLLDELIEGLDVDIVCVLL